jgi:hypothetical protein
MAKREFTREELLKEVGDLMGSEEENEKQDVASQVETSFVPSASSLPDPKSLSLEEVQKLLILEQLQDILKKRQAEQAEKARKDQVRRNNLKLAERKMREDEYIQSQCPHTKPNGMSALVGQWDHSRNYLYLCQFCNKMWKNDQVPPHLRISLDVVGGPEA